MRSATTLTREYDAWLAARIPVVRRDVTRKHGELRADRFRFLRGTYYLWLDRVVTELPEALDAVRVPLVGDLHVANFGTWRDGSGVRRWGVNDYDELATGPWLLDLLRLAVSATLVPHIARGDKAVCEALLQGYVEAKPGSDADLAEKSAQHLRRLVPPFASARKLYASLAAGHHAEPPPPAVAEEVAAIAAPGWAPTWHVREAGTGSLGHRRLVGVGPAANGRWHAREAKQLGPGTAVWAAGLDPRLPVVAPALYERVLGAVRGPAAAVRVEDWQVRDLAPDVVRIGLAGLDAADTVLLLRSMARAAADVHHADQAAWKAARKQARALDPKHFRSMVTTMAAAVVADFHAYAR